MRQDYDLADLASWATGAGFDVALHKGQPSVTARHEDVALLHLPDPTICARVSARPLTERKDLKWWVKEQLEPSFRPADCFKMLLSYSGDKRRHRDAGLRLLEHLDHHPKVSLATVQRMQRW